MLFDNLGYASALLEQPRHCIRLAQDFAVVMIFIRNFRNEGIFSFALLNNLGSASALLEQARHCIRLAHDLDNLGSASALLEQPRHCIRLAQDLDNLGYASALLEQPRHCIRLAHDFAVVTKKSTRYSTNRVLSLLSVMATAPPTPARGW